MRRLVVIALAALLLVAGRAPELAPPVAFASDGSASSNVGAIAGDDGTRAAIRSLTDEEAGLVDFNPVAATIADLLALPIPEAQPRQSRAAPTELTTYSVSAVLAGARLDDSGDIVLTLTTADDPAMRLTARLIDAAACASSADEALLSRMTAARNAFIERFGVPPAGRSIPVGGAAQVTGVGFFDSVPVSGSRSAKLVFALHPVLDLALE
jgi:hypothetical protein